MSKHGRVLVAMSGGVDSSVTAMMLHDQGYEVIGLTMKTWDYNTSGGKRETGCCSLDSINDARELAVSRGINHIILDIREEFGDAIIGNFVNEYMEGRTPNPCVLCNTFIKWEALLKRADMLDCEKIATGHYAQVREENGRYIVSRGIDHNKDQSYVLWGLKQENLARTMFPLGGWRKPEIRQMAMNSGFPALANKGDSYEICFIPDNDYRGFLKRRDPLKTAELAGGQFVSPEGDVIGEHDGYPFFTIGQRKKLGIATGEPLYVTNIDVESNRITLGKKEDLEKQEMWVRDPNFVKVAALDKGMEALTKVRYKDSGTHSTISMDGNRIKVDFHAPVQGIAPGQSAVFYEGEDVIGGGFIDRP